MYIKCFSYCAVLEKNVFYSELNVFLNQVFDNLRTMRSAKKKEIDSFFVSEPTLCAMGLQMWNADLKSIFWEK